MRALKWAAGVGGALLLLVAGGVVVLAVALDRGALTPRLAAAIESATGREARIGSVSIRPGLVPRLAAEDVTIANLPGGSRPDMARIRRLEASVALLPLLRGEVDIRGIAISGADILLERDTEGTPNWVLRPAARAAAQPAPAPAPAPHTPSPPWRIAVAAIEITDSRLTPPDPRFGTLAIAETRIEGFGRDGPVTARGRVGLLGLDASFEATAAPVAGTGWPVRASLAVGRNRVSTEGRPDEELHITAALPEPAALMPLLTAFAPGVPHPPVLPPIEADLHLDAALHPIRATLRLGAADLGMLWPDLALASAEFRMAAPDAPAEATLAATRAGLPLRATVTLTSPAALFAPTERPVAFTADLEAAGARARIAGQVERPRRREAGMVDIRLAVPDLAALAPLVPGLPPLTDVTLDARVAAPGAFTGEIRIPNFRVAAPQLQAEGALTVTPGTPLGITGRIAATRLDADALAERLAAAQRGRAPAGRAPAPAPGRPPQQAQAAQDARRVIPDTPLPVALAHAYRGRLELTADTLILDGAEWREVRGTLAIADGVARLAPFAAVTPGGPVTGEATLDAGPSPPRLTFALRSQGAGLDLGALRRAWREPAGIEGRAQIRIEAQGQGATIRAVAATLTGEAGLALVDGRLAQAGLLRLGPDLVSVLLPGAPGEGLGLRCLAIRVTAEDGMAETRALLAETSAGRIEGVAAVNLRTEALAARLLPDVTLLGLRVRAPVGVGGTLAAPRVGAEPARALAQVAGDTIANRIWRDPTVEWLRGQVTGGHPAGDCPAQLRLARFGADGPVPQQEPFVPGVPRELQGTAQEVLRGLGGALGGILGGRR